MNTDTEVTDNKNTAPLSGKNTATLGGRIEVARHASEMSRGDLADRVGVKKSTLKKWEHDQTQPRANKLYTLAGVLNCPVIWLLSGEGDEPTQPAETDSDESIASLKVELSEISDALVGVADRLQKIESGL